jgi:hypothetical protein
MYLATIPAADAAERLMNDLDQLLYATLGVALAAFLLLDETFSNNLGRVIDDATLPLNPWTAGLGAAFAVAAIVALYHERRR